VPREVGGPSAALTAVIAAADSVPKARRRVEPVDARTMRSPSPSSATRTLPLGILVLSFEGD
jgi:hypothetical protein